MVSDANGAINQDKVDIVTLGDRMNKLKTFCDSIPEEFRAPEAKEDKKAKKPAGKKAPETSATKPGAKAPSTLGPASAGGAASGLGATGPRFGASRAKKEVEDNPFKKLIDISDLMELEQNSEETLKEVQNVLLRHNSELKQWYRVYSRKIEAHKCEESFAMTLR